MAQAYTRILVDFTCRSSWACLQADYSEAIGRDLVGGLAVCTGTILHTGTQLMHPTILHTLALPRSHTIGLTCVRRTCLTSNLHTHVATGTGRFLEF
jgi:hypothetical protein